MNRYMPLAVAAVLLLTGCAPEPTDPRVAIIKSVLTTHLEGTDLESRSDALVDVVLRACNGVEVMLGETREAGGLPADPPYTDEQLATQELLMSTYRAATQAACPDR